MKGKFDTLSSDVKSEIFEAVPSSFKLGKRADTEIIITMYELENHGKKQKKGTPETFGPIVYGLDMSDDSDLHGAKVLELVLEKKWLTQLNKRDLREVKDEEEDELKKRDLGLYIIFLLTFY